MTRRTRDTTLVVITIVVSLLFIRLGIWQLHRLAERRAYNATVARRLHEPPVPVPALPRDSAAAHFRRVLLDGAYDYAHQIALVERTRNGAPGIYLLTPVRLAGTDTAVLVNRGYVYSPDGVRADVTRWQEGDSVHGTGYVIPFGAGRIGAPTLPDRPGAYRWLDAAALRSHFPYPLYPVQVVLEGDTAVHPPAPPRVPPPALDEGPHQSYAIQWFSFAIISVVGTTLFLMRSRRDAADEAARALEGESIAEETSRRG